MNHEVWVSLPEVMAVTGWSERTTYRKDANREIKSRTTGESGRNGKPIKQYASSSLPSDAQLKLFQQRMASEALVVASRSPHEIAPKLPSGPTERERIALTAEAREQAEYRLKIISPMVDFLNATNGHKPVFRNGSGEEICTLCGVAEHIAKIQQMAVSTVWDWYGRYKKNGFAALADRARADRGLSRYFSQHKDVAEFARNKFLNERLPIQLVHESISRNWDRLRNDADDKPPSYETLRQFLKTLPPVITTVARIGDTAFKNDFAPFIIRDIGAKRVNEIWVSDHMVHDVWVRNDGVFGELKENEAFRPWLTCIVDMRSRKVVGAIPCVNPSSRTISSALRMAMCRFGLPEVFYIDNGKDFKKVGKEPPDLSPEASGILFRLKVKSQRCLPRHPQSKQIESFFRTLHQRFDVIWSPFYCGTSPATRPECCDLVLREHKRFFDAGQGDKSPLPAASEFFLLLARWIDEFNETFPHSGQGMNGQTPDQVFDAEFPPEDRRPVNPVDVAELFWDRQQRTVHEGGTVKINNAIYKPADAESFAAMVNEIKREDQKILVACDPLNVGEAIALNEHGEPIARLHAQELLVHGATSQDEIQASLKTRRRMLKVTKQYLATLENSRLLAGDSTEIEDLRRRAVASSSKPHIHALPVLRAVNAPEAQRRHVDDIVDSVMEEMNGSIE